jgi:hypothetical protein
MWAATNELPTSPAHAFYVRVNRVLKAIGADACKIGGVSERPFVHRYEPGGMCRTHLRNGLFVPRAQFPQTLSNTFVVAIGKPNVVVVTSIRSRGGDVDP